MFFLSFLGVLTGVGGGLLRDVMAGVPPYIFVKHVYACASIAGAICCVLAYRSWGQIPALVIGTSGCACDSYRSGALQMESAVREAGG